MPPLHSAPLEHLGWHRAVSIQASDQDGVIGGIHAQPGAVKGFLHAESFSPTPSLAERQFRIALARHSGDPKSGAAAGNVSPLSVHHLEVHFRVGNSPVCSEHEDAWMIVPNWLCFKQCAPK